MDEEYAKPGDIASALAEITGRLGEPAATYRTSAGRVAWRLSLGVLLVLASSGLHYVLWSGLVPWPRNPILWKLVFVGLVTAPATGVYLIYFAVRGLKLWVLEYPSGLFIWHRGRVLAFPWEEICVIQIRGLPEKAELHREPGLVWYDLQRSRRRVLGTALILRRIDGEQISLPSTLDGFPELGRKVQEQTYQQIFLALWGELQNERTVSFGILSCDRDKLTIVPKSLRWRELDTMQPVAGKLCIKRVGKKRPWAQFALNHVVNPHVLLGIADAAKAPEARL